MSDHGDDPSEGTPENEGVVVARGPNDAKSQKKAAQLAKAEAKKAAAQAKKEQEARKKEMKKQAALEKAAKAREAKMRGRSATSNQDEDGEGKDHDASSPPAASEDRSRSQSRGRKQKPQRRGRGRQSHSVPPPKEPQEEAAQGNDEDDANDSSGPWSFPMHGGALVSDVPAMNDSAYGAAVSAPVPKSMEEDAAEKGKKGKKGKKKKQAQLARRSSNDRMKAEASAVVAPVGVGTPQEAPKKEFEGEMPSVLSSEDEKSGVKRVLIRVPKSCLIDAAFAPPPEIENIIDASSFEEFIYEWNMVHGGQKIDKMGEKALSANWIMSIANAICNIGALDLTFNPTWCCCRDHICCLTCTAVPCAIGNMCFCTQPLHFWATCANHCCYCVNYLKVNKGRAKILKTLQEKMETKGLDCNPTVYVRVGMANMPRPHYDSAGALKTNDFIQIETSSTPFTMFPEGTEAPPVQTMDRKRLERLPSMRKASTEIVPMPPDAKRRPKSRGPSRRGKRGVRSGRMEQETEEVADPPVVEMAKAEEELFATSGKGFGIANDGDVAEAEATEAAVVVGESKGASDDDASASDHIPATDTVESKPDVTAPIDESQADAQNDADVGKDSAPESPKDSPLRENSSKESPSRAESDSGVEASTTIPVVSNAENEVTSENRQSPAISEPKEVISNPISAVEASPNSISVIDGEDMPVDPPTSSDDDEHLQHMAPVLLPDTTSDDPTSAPDPAASPKIAQLESDEDDFKPHVGTAVGGAVPMQMSDDDDEWGA